MDFVDLDLLSYSALAITALACLFFVVRNIPLPDKWVWFVGIVCFFGTGLLNALYQLGGKYIILFPALYWIKAVQETSGALAIAIASYAVVHKSQISSHWYSLPTGCSPLAMASQYIPSDRIQAALVGVFLIYSAYLKSKKQWSPELNSIVPAGFAIFVASVCSIMNVVTYSQYCAILAVACLLFANYLRMGALVGKIKGL